MKIDTDQRCAACVDAVVADARLLRESNGWVIGADARRHWVRDGAGVCGEKVLKWETHE